RVGPREVLGEADPDAGQAGELDAVGVELAGDGEVDLPEPQLALPGEVRVGHEHPAAGRGAVGADGPAVRGGRAPQAAAVGRRRGGLLVLLAGRRLAARARA